jgi:SmpA / OmlA family
MRRRRLWLLVPLLLAALLVGGYFVLTREDRVTQETAERIQVGITRQEVRNLLGSPDGTETAKGGDKAGWLGREGIIVVVFDPNGLVAEKTFTNKPTTSLERMRLRIEHRIYGR